mgnify:CR=1 FL=1
MSEHVKKCAASVGRFTTAFAVAVSQSQSQSRCWLLVVDPLLRFRRGLPSFLPCLLACLLARLHAGSPPSFLARAALLFFDFCDGAVNDTAAPNSSPLLRNYGSLPMRFATAWHSTEGE